MEKYMIFSKKVEIDECMGAACRHCVPMLPSTQRNTGMGPRPTARNNFVMPNKEKDGRQEEHQCPDAFVESPLQSLANVVAWQECVEKRLDAADRCIEALFNRKISEQKKRR